MLPTGSKLCSLLKEYVDYRKERLNLTTEQICYSFWWSRRSQEATVTSISKSVLSEIRALKNKGFCEAYFAKF